MVSKVLPSLRKEKEMKWRRKRMGKPPRKLKILNRGTRKTAIGWGGK